jgi:hypothetical protein
MSVKGQVKAALKGVKRLLDEEDPKVLPKPAPEVPFDNRYDWVGASMKKLAKDPLCAKRPRYVQYIWGVVQGAALGKVLGYPRISVVELGVAGGAGLLMMEHLAEQVEEMVNIGIDVYGFDLGTGLPKLEDYRDIPNFFYECQYPMDQEQLAQRLRRAHLKLGRVNETIPAFIKSSPAPVAFVSFDMGIYTATRDALILFEAAHQFLLPRVACYFNSTIGFTHSEFTGERLAISEFNGAHNLRKISPIHGLRYFIPHEWFAWPWPEKCYFTHLYDHPLYNTPDSLRKQIVMDLDGNVVEAPVPPTAKSV